MLSQVAGACAIAAALAANPGSLKSLFLSANRVGDAGVFAIAQALQHHRGLQLLELGFNKLTAAGEQSKKLLLVLSITYHYKSRTSHRRRQPSDWVPCRPLKLCSTLSPERKSTLPSPWRSLFMTCSCSADNSAASTADSLSASEMLSVLHTHCCIWFCSCC